MSDKWTEGRRAHDKGLATFDCNYVGWSCWRWMAGYTSAAKAERRQRRSIHK
jgi:hypothetical protein